MKHSGSAAAICAAAIFTAQPAAAQGDPGGTPAAPNPAPSQPIPAPAPSVPASAPPPVSPQPPGTGAPPWTYHPPPPPPAEPPPAAPKNSEAEHLHDGFYLRLGLGFGWLRTASSFDGNVGNRPASEAVGDLTYTGHGLAVDLGIGGSLRPGLVLGYGFAWQLADDPTLHIDNTANADGEIERRDPLGASIHGLMVDVFPDPRGNLELGGLIGVGIVGTGGDDEASSGFAGQVWGGYGIWAAKNASLVALLRLSFARTTSDATITSSSASAPVQPTTIDRVDTTFTVGVVTGLLIN